VSRRKSSSWLPDVGPIGWLVVGVGVLALIGAGTLLQLFDGRLVSTSLRALVLLVAGVTAVVVVLALRPRPRPSITLAQFLAMSPTGFEHATAEVLGRYGYRLKVTVG